MYFIKPKNVFTRPSRYFSEVIEKIPSNYFEELEGRKIHIFTEPKTQTLVFGNQGNRRKMPLKRDPLSPSSLSHRYLMKLLKKLEVDERSYLIYLGGKPFLLVLDPSKEGMPECIEKYYEPFLNIAGTRVRDAKKVYENKVKRFEWLKEVSKIPEEVLREIFRLEKFDEELEREYAKIMRFHLISQIQNYLFDQSEKVDEKLNIFLLMSESSWYYKLMRRALKNFPEEKYELKYRNLLDLPDALGYSSLKVLTKFANYLKTQLKLDGKRLKVKEKPDVEFFIPPSFDEKSKSFNPFYDEELDDFLSFKLFSSLEFIPGRRRVTDRERVMNLDPKMFQELPPYEPIESLIIKLFDNLEPLKPVEGISQQKLKADLKASDLSPPTNLHFLYSAFKFPPPSEAKKKIYLGQILHSLMLSDPSLQNSYYINHFIWKIGGLRPTLREKYTELRFYSSINGLVVAAQPDFLLVNQSNELVIGEVKSSTAIELIYHKSHAYQMAFEKYVLESLGYRVAEVGILVYVQGPPKDPSVQSQPDIRLPILNEETVKESVEIAKERFELRKRVLKDPSLLRKMGREFDERRFTYGSYYLENLENLVKHVEKIKCSKQNIFP